MKRLKILGFILGGIVALVAVLVALALTPSVQTWAVRKAVAGQPGMTIEVARVSAGLSAADVTDFRYVKDGMVVTAKGVSAKYRAMEYLTHKRVNADSVVIEDLVIDLRNAKPSAPTPRAGEASSAPRPASTAGSPPASNARPATPSAEKKTPFEGLLKQAQLPLDLRVARLTAKGRALLPGNQTVNFDLNVSGIEAGQRGKVEWIVDFADSTAEAALRALRTTGSAVLHLTADRRIDSVEVETIASPTGPQLPKEQFKLAVKADKPTTSGDETYALSLGLMRGTAFDPLIKTDAQYLAASHAINGVWEIALRAEQLAGLLGGLGLPELAANGKGKFSLNPDTNAVAASGDLQAQTAQLQKLSPALAALGAVQLRATFDGGMADNVARLDTLNVEVAGSDGRKFAQVGSLQKITYGLADKRVTLVDPKGDLARISLQSLPLAWAQAFVKPTVIDSGDLSVVLAVAAEADGSRIHARAVEPLTLRTVTIHQGEKKFVDQVTLSVKSDIDYSAAKITVRLADLTATMPAGDAVNATISADIANLSTAPTIGFVIEARAKAVSAHKPYVPVDTGPLTVQANLEGRYEGQTLQLTKATKTVNREGGALLASLELQQPLKADLKTASFAVPKPDAAMARVRLGEIPLSWAEAFVPKSKFAGSFSGVTLEIAARSADDLTVTTTEPAAFRGVTATMDGKPMTQALDLSANLSATKHGNTIRYDLRKFEAKQGSALLIALNVAGETQLGAKMTIAAKGNLEADVPALMKQPALAPYATLARGNVTAAFDATLADAIQAKAAISAKNLVAKQDNRELGDLEVNLNANVKTDGSGTLTCPITLANTARKSDIAINGAFGKTANRETFLFTGKIASSHLYVDDFQPLAALAPAGEKSTTTSNPPPARGATPPPPRTTMPPIQPSGRDTKPFWAAVNGKAEVDLKEIVYGKDYTISGVRGTAVITDTKLSLDGLEGKFKEKPFKVAGGMTFAAQLPKPYSFTASADVQELDIGAILRAANPKEKPAFETTASLTSRLNGTGATLNDLIDHTLGKFELTGTKGVTRLLARQGVASAAVTGLSLGLAILGAKQQSEGLSAAAELSQLLNEVEFDSVKVQVERAPDLSLKLTSFELLSPILHATGTGSVASKKIEDIANAPMTVTLQLAAKGQMAYALQRGHKLSGKEDEKGYALMNQTFTVTGTPSKPDNASLWLLLAETVFGR